MIKLPFSLNEIFCVIIKSIDNLFMEIIEYNGVSTLKANVNEVWELIDNLTLGEKRMIYKKIEQEIGTELLDILDKVNERAEKDSISLEEITKEVEDVRGYLYEED